MSGPVRIQEQNRRTKNNTERERPSVWVARGPFDLVAKKIPKSRTAASPHSLIMGCGQSKGKIQDHDDLYEANFGVGFGFGDGVQKDRFIQDLDSKAIRKIARATGKYFDPEALLESIANGSIALVRGRWLLAHAEAGGKLMRRQDLPSEAFFSVEELRKLVAALGDDWGLLFVAISYRWLTAQHPDPDAFHLNIIAKVAKLYLKFETRITFYSPLVDAFERAGMGGSAADFGLMWDFMSLHQKPVGGGERTDEEAGLFKLGLGSLPIWYGHAETVMWMQPELPDGFGERVAALGLAETYEGSGWCFVESSVSAGVKHADRRLDLGLRTERALELSYGKCSSNQWDFNPECHLNVVCSAKRPPPRDPDWVAQELRTTKKFTGKGDVPVVEKLYRDFFEGVTATATTLSFSEMVLPRYACAAALDLSTNCIGGDGAAALTRAMALSAELKHVDLSSNRLCGQWYEEFEFEEDGRSSVSLARAPSQPAPLPGLFSLPALSRKGRQCGTYDASGIIALAENLKGNSVLTTLNLAPFLMDSSRIGLEGGRAIADALEVNLVLSKLTMEGLAELSIPQLRGTEPVEALDLSRTGLGVASGIVIAKLLEGNTVLQELNLSHNELCGVTQPGLPSWRYQEGATYDPTCITALAEVLRGKSALTSLDVGHNLLEEEAVLSIVRAVRQRDIMTSLGFASCKIGPVGAREIAEYAKGSVALTSLDVRGNEFDAAAKQALQDAVKGRNVVLSCEL